MRRIYDWTEIQRYHEAGHGFVACRRRFGFAHATWKKAIKQGKLLAHSRKDGTSVFDPSDRRRIYDWAAVQAYYDEGNSYRECRERFGFCAETWAKAVNRGELRTRSRSLPLAVLLSTTKSRSAVRRRLLREGVFKNECSQCGLREWRSRPLAMHIDHVNGVRDDHRLENLRMLCPNCHSQTETYAGRNAKRRRIA